MKPIIASCACGQEYTAKRWKNLKLAGIQRDIFDRHNDIELRHCVCGSTISKAIYKATGKATDQDAAQDTENEGTT